MGVSDGMGRIHLGREPPIRLGALLIEPSLRRVVHDDGREEIVEPRVMQVLVALVRSGGAILTRDDLLAACWHGVVVGEDAITRVIGRLRRLTEGIGESQLKLETITKVGYRLVAASRPGEILPDPSPRALAGERRSIYAMFTDLAGFGRLTQALQPEAVADLLNAYLDRLNRVVLEHGGIVDKFIGDAMVAFWGAPIARPDDGECAVRAAIAIRRAEEEAFRATPIGDDPPLGPTRIGLHRGDAIVGAFGGEGRTAYTALGDVMNTASGLESANSALRTTVLISREALPPSTAGDFRAMGRIVLRGRSNPVEVFEAEFDFPRGARERLNAAYARFDAGDVAALGEFSALAAEFPRDAALRRLLDRLESVGPGGVFHLGASRTAAAKSEPLLAVLAFDDLSDGADMGWFSDGVSEEILQTVASGAALKVIGRGSSFQFRGAEKAASKVAAALKATHVLDGSVRRSGSTVRIAAHLIECASETTLWSDRFDRDLSDVFTLQDEIAAAVAAALKVALAPPAKAETIDPAAYDLFLRARQKASGFSDPAAVAAAIEMLEQATALAPRFARAWTLLAQALMGQFRFHGSEKPYATMRAKVVTAADTALGIDPGLGSAYVALSGLEPIGLYAKREALFSKALSVAPNDPEVISTIGWFTASLGRLRETLGYAKQAFDLDPMYTTAANNYAIALTGVGRYSESRELWAKFCAAWPDVPVFLSNAIGDACFHADWERFDDLVRVARERGAYAGALRDLVRLGKNLRQPDPGYRNGLLQYARQELASTRNVVDRTLVALYRFGLEDETFELIDQAAFDYVVDAEKPWLSAFSVGRLLSMALNGSMIRDPRFPRLCARLGLCDYWVSSERWPDCADEGVLPYDFKAEAHRLAVAGSP